MCMFTVKHIQLSDDRLDGYDVLLDSLCKSGKPEPYDGQWICARHGLYVGMSSRTPEDRCRASAPAILNPGDQQRYQFIASLHSLERAGYPSSP